MKRNPPISTSAWERLAKLAAQAPPAPQASSDAPVGLPLGFETRLFANLRAKRSETETETENPVEIFQALVLRGLLVATVVLLGSAALSYDVLSGLVTDNVSLPGELLNSPTPLDR